MSLDRSHPVIVGVDGCKPGWICVSKSPDNAPAMLVCATFAEVVASFPDDAMIAVDMPIGLPNMTDAGGRAAEIAVRRLDSIPKNSVFAIPSRQAVFAECGSFTCQTELLGAFQRAVAIGRLTSTSNSGFSIQAFCIFPKIREVDTLLSAEVSLRHRVIESHPEVAFRSLNDWVAISRKKIKYQQNPIGIKERKAILIRHGFTSDFLDQKPPSKVGVDDFLDAACMMIVAERKVRGTAVPYPDQIICDERGLRIAIWT